MALCEQEILKLLMHSRERVSAAAWVIVRDAHVAEDIFQNTVVKALTKEVTFEAEAAVLSWAFITAKREGLDYLRKHRRETVGWDSEILDLLESDWQQEDARHASARIEALRDCVDALPDKSRQLLAWKYFDGFDGADIAERLDSSLDAVYKRLSRLHGVLRQCIEGKMSEPTAAG